MSTLLCQIDDFQSNSSKSNFSIQLKSLNFSNETENQQKQIQGGQPSNYSKIYEKIQNIQLQNKSSNNINAQTTTQLQQLNDIINNDISDRINNDQNNRYPHQKSLNQFLAPQGQQNISKQIQSNNLNEINLPKIQNNQSFTSESKLGVKIVKRRSASTLPLMNNQDISSTMSNSSSNTQTNDSPFNSYDSLFKKSMKMNQNINHLSDKNSKYYMYPIKPQYDHSQVNQKHNLQNSISNLENNNSQNFEKTNLNENNNSGTVSTLNNRELNGIKQKIKLNMNPQNEINRMKSSSFQNDQQNQKSLVKELPLIKVNSILKRRVKDIDQECNQPYLPTTNESEDEHNSSQIIAKDNKNVVPFINGLDMSDNSSTEGEDITRIESNRFSHQKDHGSVKNNKEQEINRKRCKSFSPKKNVKFAENVQVCNLHTSTKSSYKLAQKEMKQELLEQCSQIRNDFIRIQNQIFQQQQQKLNQEQLMFDIEELRKLSYQNQSGSKSEVNLMKFAPQFQIKQYSKFKILSKLDKNQEQEKYLQKIDQIDKQYKQNLATKLQTTYSLKQINQKQQQMQIQQKIQQLNQQPQQQLNRSNNLILQNNIQLKNVTPL